jgi:hypothetical protein
MAQEASGIDPMLAAAGSCGGGIEATEAIAAVHERPGRRQGQTLPARDRSVRAAKSFYIASAA